MRVYNYNEDHWLDNLGQWCSAVAAQKNNLQHFQKVRLIPPLGILIKLG